MKNLKDILNMIKVAKECGFKVEIKSAKRFQLPHKDDCGYNFGGQYRTQYLLHIIYPTGRETTTYVSGRTDLFYAMTGKLWKEGTSHSRKLKKEAAKRNV